MEGNGGVKNEDENPHSSKKVKLEEGSTSMKLWDGPSPQLSLVGNYLAEEIRGEELPESPPQIFQFTSAVDGNACLATKGRGRLFIPISMLKELSDGKSRTRELVEILAAPGVEPISEYESESKFRSDVIAELVKHHDWYWDHLITSLKPVSDYIDQKYGVKNYLFAATSFDIYATWSDIFQICKQEIDIDLIIRPTLTAEFDGYVRVPTTPSEIEETKQYLNTFRSNDAVFASEEASSVWILDSRIQFEDLDDEEKRKLIEYRHILDEDELMNTSVDDGTSDSHGTKVFKFVAATSALNTQIRFINVADSSNKINFNLVAKALQFIILSSANENVISINCSFTLHPPNDPSALIQKGRFRYFHEIIHKIGFIIFGAAGNAGHTSAHHPWGECQGCIVVGAEDYITKEVADFSSGCCGSSVNIMARGTNFSLSVNGCWWKFGGTSFSTATLSGAFSFILPNIWTVDEWTIIHEIVKKFIASTSDNKLGCSRSTENAHVPLEWKKFNFVEATKNLIPSHTNIPGVYGSSRIPQINATRTTKSSKIAKASGIIGPKLSSLPKSLANEKICQASSLVQKTTKSLFKSRFGKPPDPKPPANMNAQQGLPGGQNSTFAIDRPGLTRSYTYVRDDDNQVICSKTKPNVPQNVDIENNLTQNVIRKLQEPSLNCTQDIASTSKPDFLDICTPIASRVAPREKFNILAEDMKEDTLIVDTTLNLYTSSVQDTVIFKSYMMDVSKSTTMLLCLGDDSRHKNTLVPLLPVDGDPIEVYDKVNLASCAESSAPIDVRNKQRFSFGQDLTEWTLDCSIELCDSSVRSSAANVDSPSHLKKHHSVDEKSLSIDMFKKDLEICNWIRDK